MLIRSFKVNCLKHVAIAGMVFVMMPFSNVIHGQNDSLATADDLAAGNDISLELIMSDQDWLGQQPQNAYWGDLGEWFYYTRKRPGATINDLYRASVSEKTLAERVEPDQAAKESVAGGDWRYDPATNRFNEKVYVREGDVYHRDLTNGTITQLTRTTARESQPLLLSDGSIGFRRGDTFYIRNLETGLESEPFPLIFSKEPNEKKLDEAKEKTLLARQQDRLFDMLQNKEKQKDLREAEKQRHQKEDPSLPGTPFYLGDDVDLGIAALSPSGRHLALVTLPKKRPKPSKTKMPSWVTSSGDIETRDVRSKVGAAKPFYSKLLLLDRRTRKVVEIKTDSLPDVANDPLEELKALAKQREEDRKKALETSTENESVTPAYGVSQNDEKDAQGEGKEKKETKSRPIDIRSLSFNHDGTALVFQAFSLDNKDRWLGSVDLENGTCHSLHHLRDLAWINWRHNQYGWSRDGRQLWFQSEETGFAHLYLVDVSPTLNENTDDQKHSPLTQGDYIATEPQLSVDGRFLYFRGNKEHPGQYEIYRTSLSDGTIQQITNLGGMASAVLSPDGNRLLITHSTSTRPPELFIQSVELDAAVVQRTDTISEVFQRRNWTAPKIVEIPSNHGSHVIHSRLYLPEEKTVEKRPAVLFVHGAGYLQNAHKGWSGYSREFMFHSFLVERGFVVLDMDYRGSAGYGRDWRTAIYRHMGSVELEDLRDGVDWLVEKHGVDRDRVGVYGGSYGGFLTLMALFNESDLFAAGAALRPVTDWAHYNHGYTSRILNTPELDPEAYRRSSPIEFAHGLNKPLLICAPMLDDNVFFQDSVRLVQRLIELQKEDWWIAIYPIEPHGFREPTSWLDEYRRIWDLFERYL